MILVDQDLEPHPAPGSAAHSNLTARPATGKHHQLPSQRTLAQFLRLAQDAIPLRGQVSVLLTTDKAIRNLNRRFRGIEKATDVLSFPAVEGASHGTAGDIAISVPVSVRQANEQGHSLSEEIKILILHGLLHLAGYDHETDNGRMARRERLLRTKLRLPLGLIERSKGDDLHESRKGTGNEDKCQGTTSVVPKESLISLPNRGLQPAKRQLSGRFLQPLQPVGMRSGLIAKAEVRLPAHVASAAKAPLQSNGRTYGLKPVSSAASIPGGSSNGCPILAPAVGRKGGKPRAPVRSRKP